MTCCRDSAQLTQAADIVQQQPRKRRLCLKTHRSTTRLYVPLRTLFLPIPRLPVPPPPA